MAATDEDLPEFDLLWDHDDPSETERAFRRLLAPARASGNASYLAELLTQIARAEGLQRKFEDAHQTLREVEALLATVDDRATIRYMLERGRVFNSSKRRDEARECFLEAYRLAQDSAEEFYAVDAAHMMGITEPSERRLEWNLKAAKLADQSLDPRARGWLGSLYNNIAWTYLDLGRHEEALATFQKGLTWREQEGNPRKIGIAAWTVARALRSLGRYEEALQSQRENVQRTQGSGDPDGYIQEEMGECLLALGREVEAREHFARAFAVLSQDSWLKDSEPERLKRLAQLGGAQP